MAAVAAPAEPAPGGAPGAPALLSVRALPENATQAERNKAKKTWPPVENGGRFVLFVDDLRLDEYTTPRCDVRMVVHHDGSLSCDEPNCENPPFGASTYTRAAASAAKHLRAYHLKKLVRSAIVDTDAKKKRKQDEHERCGENRGPHPHGRWRCAYSRSFKVLPRADVSEARKKEHEAAQSARQEMEDKAKMRRETIAAAAMDAAAASAADAAKLTAAETATSEMISAAGPGQFERGRTIGCAVLCCVLLRLVVAVDCWHSCHAGRARAPLTRREMASAAHERTRGHARRGGTHSNRGCFVLVFFG